MRILTMSALLLGSLVWAQQTYSISGKILDSAKKPITDAEIYLYDNDNQLVKSTFSQDSTFQFSGVENKKYYLKIISDGNTQQEAPFLLQHDENLIITISSKTQNIDEVKIDGKRKTFKYDKGNLSIDVANSTFNTLATSTDLLGKLPGVMLSPDRESLSIVGKGIPLLYIDNQKTDFSSLQSLSVDDIKSIEIINNPSAQYEAEGKAVVKIILKNSRKDGVKLSINETFSLKRKWNQYLGANLQVKKNKTEWKINANYNYLNPWEGNGFDYSVADQNIKSNYFIKSETKRPHYILGTSVYQDLNDGDYLSFSINGYTQKDTGPITNQTQYSQNNVATNIVTLNNETNQRDFVNSFFNYNKKLKSIDANIFTGFQFTRYNSDVNYSFLNNTNDQGFVFDNARKNKYDINAYSGRIDIEKDFKNDLKLEFGGSYTFADANTNNLTTYTDPKPSSAFLYNFKESNVGTYGQLSLESGKWSYKAGIRMETTSAKGINKATEIEDISRHFVDWFGSGEISYKIDDKKNLTLNYAKTIERPNYSSISSGNLYGSPYIEYAGNYNIVPSYTHTLTATAVLNKVSFNASFYSTKNPMGMTLVYDQARNVSVFSPVNFDKDLGFSVGVDVPFEYKIWTSQNSASILYDQTKDKTAVLRKSTPYLYLYSNNTFKLTKNLKFLLDANWITKRTEGIYERNGQMILNLGLTQHVKDFDFTLRFNDVFKQMVYSEILHYGAINSKNKFIVDGREVALSIKYNFGKITKSDFKESKINETESRIK